MFWSASLDEINVFAPRHRIRLPNFSKGKVIILKHGLHMIKAHACGKPKAWKLAPELKLISLLNSSSLYVQLLRAIASKSTLVNPASLLSAPFNQPHVTGQTSSPFSPNPW
jgi:hypothetical protein